MEIERDPTAKAQLKLRVREPLRALLAERAKQNETSLNTEIAMRLQTSLRDEDMGEVVFGDRRTYVLISQVARIIRIFEIKRGKTIVQDTSLFSDALGAAKLVWEKILAQSAE